MLLRLALCLRTDQYINHSRPTGMFNASRQSCLQLFDCTAEKALSSLAKFCQALITAFRCQSQRWCPVDKTREFD